MKQNPQILGLGILGLQKVIIKRYSAHVLHGPDPVLRTEYLIILLKGKFRSDKFLEEANASGNHPEKFFSINIVDLTVSEKDLHRNGSRRIIVHNNVVLPCADIVNVCRDWRALLEGMQPEGQLCLSFIRILLLINQILKTVETLKLLDILCLGVGHDLPVLGRCKHFEV